MGCTSGSKTEAEHFIPADLCKKPRKPLNSNVEAHSEPAMSNYSDIISTVALVTSIGSLSVSGYVAFCDLSRLKIMSRYFATSAYGPSRIVLTLINKGRRPVILRLIGGASEDGKWAATFLEHEKERAFVLANTSVTSTGSRRKTPSAFIPSTKLFF